MDKLPQELIDKIIGSLDPTIPSGYSALSACSLVGRSWRRQAQKGLFSSLLLNEDGLKKWDCDISLQSEIPSYVRYLGWNILSATTGQSGPFLESTFPGHFTSFSNLEFLHLPELFLNSLDTTAIDRIFGHIGRSLRHVDISHLKTDPERLCLFASLLPNLRYIYTPIVTMLEGGGTGPENRMSFDFTGHIAPYYPETERFFRCIAGLHPRFESFEVRIIDDELIDTFNLVLRSCSTTLKTLIITPPIHGMLDGNSI